MQSFDEAVETLINLGLKVLQAKVYLTLAKLGTSTGRATAKEAKVAPQDVYRVLTELQEAGLVEKIIAKPNKYQAMPLDQGLSMLLERRNNQTERLKKAVSTVSRLFPAFCNETQEKDMGDFVLVAKDEPIRNKATRMIETAHVSLDLMNEINEGMTAYDNLYNLEMKLLKKGGKIRDILCKETSNFQVAKCFSALLQRYPDFQVRYLNFSPAKIIIKDGKEVLLSTKTKAKTFQQPFLWTDNPILVHIIQQWYNGIWDKSSQENVILHLPKRSIEAKNNSKYP
jgi:DNA-binding MarR family transcriptional regulator